jgi:hypothetical protein
LYKTYQRRQECVYIEAIGPAKLCSTKTLDSLGRQLRKPFIVPRAASCDVNDPKQ